MEGGNPQRSGLSPYNTTNLSSEGWWSFSTADIEGSNSDEKLEGLYVAPDGTIYSQVDNFGKGGLDGLLALNPNGTIKWFSNGTAGVGNIGESIALGQDGTIYSWVNVAFLPYEFRVRALDPNDGSIKWEYAPIGGHADGGTRLVVSPNGELLITGEVEEGVWGINALHPNGTLSWSLALEHIGNLLAVGPDSTIYAASYGGHLYSISPDGTILWKVTIPAFQYPFGRDTKSISLDTAGNIYILADGISELKSYLTKFDPNGTPEWTYVAEDCNIIGWPVIDGQGNIYTSFQNVTRDGPNGGVREDPGILSLSPAGQPRWLVRHQLARMAMSADGIIYGASTDSFFALRPDGSMLWQRDTLHAPSPLTLNFDGGRYIAIGPDGTVYFVGEIDMSDAYSAYVLAIHGTPHIVDAGLDHQYIILAISVCFMAALLVILYIAKKRGEGWEQ